MLKLMKRFDDASFFGHQFLFFAKNPKATLSNDFSVKVAQRKKERKNERKNM